MHVLEINHDAERTACRRRSSRWPRVRAQHLKAHRTCAVCGSSRHLEVHHIRPFHKFPELELDPANLITLCEEPGHNCHLTFGHLLQWTSWNASVAQDAQAYLERLLARPA